jgi:hypothetical protein
VLTLKEALLPRAMFDELPEYSCSLPTGTRIGKCWKRNTLATTPLSRDGPWLLGCFERIIPGDGRPGRAGKDRVLIRWRTITIVEDD